MHRTFQTFCRRKLPMSVPTCSRRTLDAAHGCDEANDSHEQDTRNVAAHVLKAPSYRQQDSNPWIEITWNYRYAIDEIMILNPWSNIHIPFYSRLYYHSESLEHNHIFRRCSVLDYVWVCWLLLRATYIISQKWYIQCIYTHIYIHRMIIMQTWLGTVVSDCKSLSSGNPISQGCGLLQPPKQLCRHRATLVSGNLTWQWKLPFNGKIICCTYKWMQTCEIFLVEITWRWLVVI